MVDSHGAAGGSSNNGKGYGGGGHGSDGGQTGIVLITLEQDFNIQYNQKNKMQIAK